jgi:N6-L-threonylcarbamoyladenine synthase
LKTSILYFLRDKLKEDDYFIENNKADLSAAIQSTIIEILMDKLKKAAIQTGINQIAIAGGVSANSGLREAIVKAGIENGWKTFIPPFKFTTDNAAMIAIAGYFKYLNNDFASQNLTPYARSKF